MADVQSSPPYNLISLRWRRWFETTRCGAYQQVPSSQLTSTQNVYRSRRLNRLPIWEWKYVTECPTVVEYYRKSLILLASEASYVYILSVKSSSKMQKWSILKLEDYGQTALPDRSLLIGQKFKCDILSHIQTVCLPKWTRKFCKMRLFKWFSSTVDSVNNGKNFIFLFFVKRLLLWQVMKNWTLVVHKMS